MISNEILYETILSSVDDINSCLQDMEGGHTVLTIMCLLLQEFVACGNSAAADTVIKTLCEMAEVSIEIEDEMEPEQKEYWQTLFLEMLTDCLDHSSTDT